MVTVAYHEDFKKQVTKIKDGLTKKRIKKQIQKIISNPESGKPMRYTRKGTRELYIPPYRLSYIFYKEEDTIVLLTLYHKDEQ